MKSVINPEIEVSHQCLVPDKAADGRCGHAVTYCEETACGNDSPQAHEAGTLFAGNGEYESQVNYCPFCGYKASEPVATE